MACDYQGIRADNERRYGTDIGRIGPMLLANRYDDRTHFIFELLQNAEDALARRVEWQGSRSVTFYLKEGGLQVSHFGQPFDEADVRGICGIAETTKDLTAIGRFGIGFKSVYAFTERPEIHSGAEDFAIESFVWPVAVPPLSRDADSTAILIPLRPDDDDGCMEIASGLSRLGASSLLFLRQIEEIRWGVQGGSSGLYLRESTDIAPGIRRITVIGQEYGKAEVDEQWLVFSRPICADDGEVAGHIEIAWSIAVGGRERLRRVERSPLVVFFPTVLETHLGFLLQGPYRTTPSRDNVPSRDQWNQRCVRATAELLIEALCWLRHQGLLDAAALRCLPLDHAKFAEDSMFAPLFEATKDALTNERLLPCSSDGYASAKECRFARTRELRELLSSAQLSSLFAEVTPLHWLSGDISQDRTPELRLYLMRELDVGEVTPETVLPKLSAAFLEGQSDEWILRLYEFLNGQPALKQRAAALPLVRLSNGAHLRAIVNGQPHAFLPGPVETGFPTVRRTVCESEEARAFLRSLGLTEPDPVDDVIWNVLPKYRANEVDVPDAAYESDIARVMAAFATDSKGQREKLITALRETTFVMAVDAGDTHEYVERPGELYITTDRLKELFASVPGVMLTDNRYKSLRGEDVRGLLEACGAVRYLRPISDNSLSWQARARLREQAGHADTSGYNDRVTDWTLQGLEDLLKHLPKLDRAERTTRARLLWEELGNLEERRGKGIFTGEYSWTHYGSYRITFDAAFVRALNASAWVPGADGNLHRPSSVLLDSLDWKPNPFLLSKIPFKPPVIDQLAREAGIEPGVLELLKKLGVTSEAKLRERLGLRAEREDKTGEDPGDVKDALKELLGDAPQPTPPVPDPDRSEPAPGRTADAGDGGGAKPRTSMTGSAGGEGAGGRSKGAGQDDGSPIPKSKGGRPFLSYVAAHAEDEEPDPDGLDQEARIALENEAITFILRREPEWRRTPIHNPGFDLYQGAAPDAATRLCEVKAMTGTLEDRPVGLSRAQFDCARMHRESYWLYAVEQAGTDHANLVRIQDPAGKARTFTFDRGWREVAEVDGDTHDGVSH